MVSRDASAAGGATDACAANVKRGLRRILEVGASDSGRALLGSTLRLCAAPRSPSEVYRVKSFVEGPWATLAMGDYPYSSSYLMHGDALLPPWPVRAACKPLAHVSPDTDAALFDALRRAVSVYHNASGDAGHCFNVTGADADAPAAAPPSRPIVSAHPAARRTMRSPLASPPAKPLAGRELRDSLGAGSCEGNWGYQWCTEMVQPFTSGTPKDMFYPYAPYNFTTSAAGCEQQWGVRPREEWARIGLGGKRITDASNIIFSNGAYDPWSRGGVQHSPSPSLIAVTIPSGAHHIDLMFSDEADPPDVSAARQKEMGIIHGWIEQKQKKGVE